MNFRQAAEFARDLKALSKRWRTLDADLMIATATLEQLYCSTETPSRAILLQSFFDGKRATRLQQTEDYEVVKMRFDCSAPGAQGKLRLVFIYTVADATIQFIELYAKNDKSREDPSRIAHHLNQT